jgi:hypothetical protein
MKLKTFIVLIVIIIAGFIINQYTNIDNLLFVPAEMSVTPIELNRRERELVSLFSDMSPYMLKYAINDDVKSIQYEFTDYSDAENPKTETLFSLINDSKEMLKGTIAISYDLNQARITVKNDSIASVLKEFNEIYPDVTTFTLYLNEPYKIELNEPVPIMAVIKTKSSMMPDKTVEDFVENPEFFKQYENVYLITVTFYDKFIDLRNVQESLSNN